MEFDTHDASMAPVLDLMKRGQFDRAYALCRPLAEDGSPDAQLRVGWMFHTGNGVLKSVEQAHYWYERAVLAGSAQAEFYLGSLFWNTHEFQKALEWFQRSASHGFVPALYHLARMYRHGVGVEIDEQKARHYVEQAAQGGHLLARRDIAREMLRGHRGVARIPLGVFMFWVLFWRVYRTALKNVHDDTLLRL